MKGTSCAKISQYSIHLMYEVWASLVNTLLIRLVMVSITVRLVAIAVLKKFGRRKKEVA